MTVSGRFVALLALGVVPVVLLGEEAALAYAALGGWVLVCVVLGAIDLALAASPRRLSVSRELPARVRLGAEAPAELFVTNTGTRTLRGVLRDAWRFTGFVMSDFYWGIYDGPAALNAGLDLEMPFRRKFRKLAEAVEFHEVDAARIDESAKRILAQELRFAHIGEPERYRAAAVASAAHTALAREAAGFPPVPLEAVARVEQQAVGHVDYTAKFALYCAELATREQP